MSEDEEGRAHARSAGGIPWAPGAAWYFLWEALVRHTGTAVVIVDGEGRFRFANEEAARSLGPAAEVVGRTIHEYFPPDFAEERLAYIRRVLATKQPLAVVGMVRGTLSIATIRPLQGKDATVDSVMVACRPITQADQLPSREANEPEVVEAEVHDMGHLARLSRSEFEVLRLIGYGLSTTQMAKRLSCSSETVEWHRAAIGRKLGVSNRVEVADLASRAGLAHFVA